MLTLVLYGLSVKRVMFLLFCPVELKSKTQVPCNVNQIFCACDNRFSSKKIESLRLYFLFCPPLPVQNNGKQVLYARVLM